MHFNHSWGFILLSILLILWGIVNLIGGGGALTIIMAILAIAAGVLILLER
jgi:hypothetical protein